MTKYRTLVQWQDSSDKYHEVGEVADLSHITDLADLLAIKTVEALPAEPSRFESKKPTVAKDESEEITNG